MLEMLVGQKKNRQTNKQTEPTLSQLSLADLLLLPVVAQLDGGAVEDAAEGDWLDLPVCHGVAKEADSGVHSLLSVVAWRAEVFRSHSCDLVVMEIDYLRKSPQMTKVNLLSFRHLFIFLQF